MKYEYRYTLNDNDYLEFNRFHLNNHPANKRAIMTLRFLMPAICAVLLIFAIFTYEELSELVAQIIVYAIVSVAWFFIVKPLFMLVLKLNIKSLKKHGKLPYGKEVTIVFGDESFTETTPDTEIKTFYRVIERIGISDKAVYIYMNSIQAVIVPFCVFMPMSEKDEFISFIRAKATQAR